MNRERLVDVLVKCSKENMRDHARFNGIDLSAEDYELLVSDYSRFLKPHIEQFVKEMEEEYKYE